MNPGNLSDGTLNLLTVSLVDQSVSRYVARTLTTKILEVIGYIKAFLVSLLEWINCGTDTGSSLDNSKDNSTEEEDQV